MKEKEPPTPNEPKEPVIPIRIPMTIIRWLSYSICFFALLIPFNHTVWQWICGALILGWFAGMLNAIINKKQYDRQENSRA
jgi:hypothetical protein